MTRAVRRTVGAALLALVLAVTGAGAAQACGYWDCTWYDGVVVCYWYEG